MTVSKHLAVGVAVLSIAGPAAAQDFQINNDLVRGYTNNMVSTVVRESLLGIDSRRSGVRSAAPARPGVTGTNATAAATTAYRPAPAVTARVRSQYLAFVARTSGAAISEQLGREFARQDYVRMWADQAAEDGLHGNDVADALTGYWVQNWLIAHGRTSAPREQISAARAQFQSLLTRNPAFAQLTEAQRQEMAETFIYNLVVQGAAYAGAVKGGDVALKRRLSDAAAERFRLEMGVDLRRMTLTSRGFNGAG